jgi:membrane associated rhomboid family serine protease
VLAFLAAGRFGFDSGGGIELFRQGALLGIGLDGNKLIGVHEGEYWRLVTGGFLHANLLHIAFNMYLLYLLGQMLEPVYGSARFAALYAAALLCGSLGALLQSTTTLTVGASGAVFGLMGAAFMELRARGIDPWRSDIGMLIALNLGLSFVLSGVSLGGHIGGLIGGGVAALGIQAIDRERLPRWTALALCGAICIAAAAGAIAVSGDIHNTRIGL